MLATEPLLAIVWDEGYTLGRQERIRNWFRGLRDPAGFAARWTPPSPLEELVQKVAGELPPRPDQIDSRRELLLDPGVVAYFWPFAREEPHGHPPFYAVLGLMGDLLAPSWKPLPRARLGPILLFSLTAALLFRFVAVRWGSWAGIAAAGSWLLQPNLFGHGHYATYDAVLASLWVLAIVAFAGSIRELENGPLTHRRVRWLASVGFGVVVGCALATKLTGWFLPVPFVLWTLWFRPQDGLRSLLVGGVVAVLVLYLLVPPWWTEPITGPLRFFQSNLTRGRTIPIPVLFLGKVYQTPNESLPWYNTLIWTFLVTPVGFLGLGGAGLYRAARGLRTEPLGVLIVLHWLLLIGLRALPHTPGHDGVRLFLPAFGMLAMLAGIGRRRDSWREGPGFRLAVSAALVEGVASLVVFMPVPLSYYSPLVGSLPGAARIGMEPTYYWDALGPEARRWLREHTGPTETIRFSSFPTSWLYLRSEGELPRLFPIDAGSIAWYVLQNRGGAWSREERRLVAAATPAFTVTKLGVPLIWIFPISETERILRPPRGP